MHGCRLWSASLQLPLSERLMNTHQYSDTGDTQNECSTPVPFSFFASLIREISSISPRKGRVGKDTVDAQRGKALRTLERWIAELRRRFPSPPSNTILQFFHFFFPEDDIRRKYELKETRLAEHLADIFNVSTARHSRGSPLRRWNSEETTGCLGEVLRRLLESTSNDIDWRVGSLSMLEVDQLLDELASTSAFSHTLMRSKSAPRYSRRSRADILQQLFSDMPPLDAAILAQIVLKDLRPLLYPVGEAQSSVALLQYNSKAVFVITKFDAMKLWDLSGKLLRLYRVRASLDDVVAGFQDTTSKSICPQLGAPITIPKCQKGQGCTHALSLLSDPERVWAEVKHDGELMQLHVTANPDKPPTIQIFSKSLRDSTSDRKATHWIIQAALGLFANEAMHPNISADSVERKPLMNVILDAEMVAYSDSTQRIDEFWRIRSLVENTAEGPRGQQRSKRKVDHDSQMDSQCSMVSNASDSNERHLGIVFFDVLYLNDVSLLDTPYHSRRQILESLIIPMAGRAMLAERTPIDTQRGTVNSGAELRHIFARAIADHQEGLVLKGHNSRYNDWRCPWVKLKRDYIPGFGDTLDMVCLGAKWDKARGRELRVAPNIFTTFYVGVLLNASECRAKPMTKPHFYIYFTVSYGLTRQQLEEENFRIRSLSSDRVESYTYELLSGLQPPAVMFVDPILAELMGAGFTKALGSKHYELRFPRILKCFRLGERSWRDALDADALHRVARTAVGRDRSNKDVDDWCNSLWRKLSSPSVKDAKKRSAAEREWEDRLADFDARKRRKTICLDGGIDILSSAPSARRNVENDSARALSRAAVKLVKESNSEACQGPLSFSANISLPSSRANLFQETSQQHVSLMKCLSGSTVCPESLQRSRDFTLTQHLRPPKPHPQKATSPHYSDTGVPLFSASKVAPPHDLSNPKFTTTRAENPMGHFLSCAYVFLAQPYQNLCNRSPSRPPALPSIIPKNQRLYSLDAFLYACGWHGLSTVQAPVSTRSGRDIQAKYGVLLVNQRDPEGREWKAKVLTKLEETRRAMQREGTAATTLLTVRPKPIWVFDVDEISYEVPQLHPGSVAGLDPKEKALFLFD